MAIRAGQVYFKDQVAGTLIETANGGSRFIYGEKWDKDIACTLPATQREHEWKQGLHPFFQHLAPEGWLREKQARVAHVEEEDDFGLLLRFGADCIGAVGVQPAADGKADFAPITELTASPGRTVSGIQRKLLAVKEGSEFAPAGAYGFAPYIAKFDSDREQVQSLVRNEALSLRWSAELLGKDEVNAHQIGQVSVVNETALIVTRFDRTSEGKKLRLEDFAQILKKSRGNDYAGKYDAAYEDVAAAVREHSSRADIDVARFFRRLLVFALVGNCDAHLKNFSLLETYSGLRLSPAYDIVNTAFYDGFDQTIALSINGTKPHLDEVTPKLLTDFGKSIGINERAIEQIFSDVRARVQRAAHILKPPQGEPPDGFIHRYSEIVSRACLRILSE